MLGANSTKNKKPQRVTTGMLKGDANVPVVIIAKVNEELWALEVPRRDTDIILLPRMVELGQSPVDKPQRAGTLVEDNVMGLDIAVHDTVTVGVLEGLEDLEDVEADICGKESGEERLEVLVVDVLEDEGGDFGVRVAADVKKGDDIGTAAQALENLDLALDLLLLDRLQNLDNTLLIAAGRVNMHRLEDVAIFPPADLAHNLVVVLVAPSHLQKIKSQTIFPRPPLSL